MCLKLTVRTPEQRRWHHSGIITDFTHLPSVSIDDFEESNASSVFGQEH